MNRTAGISRSHRLEQQRHTFAVCIGGATLAATLGGWIPSSAVAWMIAVVAIAVGLPHGALDIMIGPRLAKPQLFFGLYLAGVVGVVLVWLAAPAFGLVAFFISSWYHFARGDADHHRDLGRAGKLLGMSTAGCAVGLPLALHAGVVTPVLSDLMLGSAALTSHQVSLFGSLIAVPSLAAGMVASVAALRNRRYSALVEIVTIALVAAFVHPLISFALYFALWHAPRHLITLDIDRQSWWRAVGVTAVTLLAGAWISQLVEPTSPAAARVVFIGLAALTGPHLVITELVRSRQAPQQNPNSGRIVQSKDGQRGVASPTWHRSRASSRS